MPAGTTAQRIAKAMAEVGLSRAQLVKAAPIDAKHLRRLLKGEVGLGRRKAEELATPLKKTAAWLLAIDESPDAVPTAVSEPAVTPYAARMGGWFEELPDDIQAVTYFLGACLNDREEFGRLAEVARKALRRMGRGTPSSADKARTQQAVATRGARQKKASGR